MADGKTHRDGEVVFTMQLLSTAENIERRRTGKRAILLLAHVQVYLAVSL